MAAKPDQAVSCRRGTAASLQKNDQIVMVDFETHRGGPVHKLNARSFQMKPSPLLEAPLDYGTLYKSHNRCQCNWQSVQK